jgi:micrococcal nuclease
MSRLIARWLLILLILPAFALAVPIAAAGPLDDIDGLEPGGTVDVAATIDGETLRLADGRELRLAAIEVPAPALPRSGRMRTDDEPDAGAVAALATAARDALAELTAQRTVAIYYDQRRNDRYGRIVAQVVAPPALWIEAELLRRGLARVQTTRDVAAAAPDLLRSEAEARAAQRGMWALATYRVHDARNLGRWLDSFQIVAGRIAGSHRSPGRLWLEFAGERGEALELSIPSAANRLFRAAAVDPAGLVGADVRVRGWLRWQNGPIIDVDHPAQIEIMNSPRRH